MSRPCTICSLPDHRRRKLERQLMTENNTAVAAASALSRFALARHRKHMNAAMVAAYFAAPPEECDKAMVAYGSDLQAEVRSLIDEANQLRATERDVRAELKGIDSALKALELYAKLSGQLQGRSTTICTCIRRCPAVKRRLKLRRRPWRYSHHTWAVRPLVPIDTGSSSEGEPPGESEGS